MKKLVFVGLVFLLMSGCIVYQTSVPHIEYSIVIDFTKYSKKDFLFSTSNYGGKYESVGILTSKFFPEVKQKGRGDKGENYDKDKYTEIDGFLVEKSDFDNVLQTMYNDAKKMGANAVIEIDFTYEEHPIRKHPTIVPFNESSGWIITGMGIKRLN